MIFIELTIITLLGLSFGSFISMLSYRIQTEEEISLFKKSFCPKCKNNLGIFNLIPFFSWLIQKGKCYFCHKKIPIRYPLIELSFLFIYIFLFFFTKKPIDISFLPLTLLFIVIATGIITDFENYHVPEHFNKICFILALIWQIIYLSKYPVDIPKPFYVNMLNYISTPYYINISYYILSSFIFWTFSIILRWLFMKIRKSDPLGMGDIGFFATCGLILGLHLFNHFILFCGIFGLLLGKIWQKFFQQKYFPFIPPMTLSLIICMYLK